MRTRKNTQLSTTWRHLTADIMLSNRSGHMFHVDHRGGRGKIQKTIMTYTSYGVS